MIGERKITAVPTKYFFVRRPSLRSGAKADMSRTLSYDTGRVQSFSVYFTN
jgi:hypothetical protein